MSRRRIESVRVGDVLGPRSVLVDRKALIAYAAASGDHNRIHWDGDFAKEVGLPDVIAHGMRTMAVAGELVSEWAGDPASVVEFGVRFSGMVVVPREGQVVLEVSGRVAALKEGRAVIDLVVTCGEDKVLSGAKAVVELGRQEESDGA